MKNNIRKWEVYYVDLNSGVIGSEQRGIRPCLIFQNDIGNIYSPTTIIIPITTKVKKFNKSHVKLTQLNDDSYLLCEQIRVVDKSRILNYIDKITDKCLREKITEAVKAQLQL